MSSARKSSASPRVFLSYTREDKPAVLEIHKRLTEKGFDVWLDDEELVPGLEWEHEIEEALRRCDAVVICLSRRSLETVGFFQKELRMALSLAEQRPRGSLFIIPLRLEPCSVPSPLRSWHYVDLSDPRGYEKLFRSLESLEPRPRADW